MKIREKINSYYFLSESIVGIGPGVFLSMSGSIYQHSSEINSKTKKLILAKYKDESGRGINPSSLFSSA